MDRQASGWTTGVAVVVGIFAIATSWVIAAGGQEVRSDVGDLRHGGREVRQDARAVRQDRREMRQDRQAFRDAMASGDHGAAMRIERDLVADHREMRRDIHRLCRDERDLRHDRHGFHRYRPALPTSDDRHGSAGPRTMSCRQHVNGWG